MNSRHGIARLVVVLLGASACIGAGTAPEARHADSAVALRAVLERSPEVSFLGRVEAGPRLASAAAAGLTADTTVENGLADGWFVLRTEFHRVAPPQIPHEQPAADWVFDLGGDARRYRPLEHRADVWYGSTYFTGPEWTRVGKDWQHPGEATASVRRFTAPHDGRVTIAGRAAKAHVEPTSDGVHLAIRHEAREVWSAEIDGGDAIGVETYMTLQVRKGDALRFIVAKRGLIFCDTTRWDPVIVYADGETFRASAGFSAERGPGPWSYELEADPRATVGLPVVHWLCRDLALEQSAVAAGLSAKIGGAETLPVAVLSDGADSGGLALVLLGAGGGELACAVDAAGRLVLELSGGSGGEIGETVRVPALAIRPFRGSWIRGMSFAGDPASRGLRGLDSSVPATITAGLEAAGVEDLGLWLHVQADWREEDRIDDSAAAWASAMERHLGKTRALIDDLRGNQDLLAAQSARMDALQAQAARPPATAAAQRALWLAVRTLKRRIALANPLLASREMLFAKRVPTSYSHLVMQYFGWRARPGGGLFVLERPGRSLACRDIAAGRLAEGSVLEPRLSPDGRRVVFSYVRPLAGEVDPTRLANDADRGFFHIGVIDVDGGGLRMLTEGPWEDLMPEWLPDGGIVFSSTRRRGYARCFGAQFSPRWHVYTLHRMDSDGANLRALSVHDTNEWFPCVAADGSILYSRWDYIDRDAVTHQNLWTTRPDGTAPAVLWGNATDSPHCAFQAKPVPGSRKIVFTASAHHSITAGSIALLDPDLARDGHSAIVRLTPEVAFPEAEGNDIRAYYESPWPLSERYFLVAYSPRPLVWEPGANEAAALGLYLLDAFGNRELLFRDPVIGSTSPCVLAPRPAAPHVACTSPERAPAVGEMILSDVYRGLGATVRRGEVKELRIVQIFPKGTNVANAPPIGLAGEENGRAILGTVPVGADGSARFLVPAGRPLLFQALDADGLAVQTMRTVTYVQPGETIACAGCHEDRMSAPPVGPAPLALRRPPSTIAAGELGGRPFSFVEVVGPVLERRCVQCHGGAQLEGKVDLTSAPRGGFTQAYLALCGDRDFSGAGTNPKNAAEALVPRFGMRNRIVVTPPGGAYGARGSRLLRMLRDGHAGVELDSPELRRLAAWIDLNAIFYGVSLPEDQARQLRGERVAMPELQ